MWDKKWDKVFAGKEWGKYPPEELIRFIARNYYSYADRKSVKILEIGSGTGANIWFLAREGFDAYGVDGSAVGVRQSAQRLKEEGLSARVLKADAQKLPFKDGMFDCVLDNECIFSNSYKDSKKIIDEVSRVLKPGGKFFSKTFMTGTYGDGNGTKLKGEENTYTELRESALCNNHGIIRFTSEKEISDLYGCFNIDSVDYSIRSEKGGKHEVKEWIIVCSKKNEKSYAPR